MKHLTTDQRLALASKAIGFVSIASIVLAVVHDSWKLQGWFGVWVAACLIEATIAIVQSRRSRARIAAHRKRLDADWAALIAEMKERAPEYSFIRSRDGSDLRGTGKLPK